MHSKCIIFCAFAMASGALQGQGDLSGTIGLDPDDRLIRYSASNDLRDPVAEFVRRLDAGEAKLVWEPEHGYLKSLLAGLKVPVTSQTLVYSKTSLQTHRISPETPRAIYFNDDVYVGWIPHADVMEISSVDPNKGGIFYTLDQRQSARPRPRRQDECLQCHQSPRTLGVPGHMMRSVFTGPDGFPVFQAGGFNTDHRSPLAERWGGWYVTGTHPGQHMGNGFLKGSDDPNAYQRGPGSNVQSLEGRFDRAPYLSPHSDIVALMVLGHQTRVHNLIARVNWEVRIALDQQRSMNRALGKPEGEWWDSTVRRVRNPVEVLLQSLLLADEALLDGPVRGTSGFAADFSAAGPRDKEGRSLRQLDLRRRLFRYPCSFLIYSPALAELPAEAKDRLYSRLWEVLSGADRSKPFERLSSVDRTAVREILEKTHPEIAAAFAKARSAAQ